MPAGDFHYTMTGWLCNNEMFRFKGIRVLELKIAGSRVKSRISNFESLSVLIGDSRPDSSIRGLIRVFLFAFFRAKVNRFASIINPYGKTRIHVHAAHRVFHHLVCRIRGAAVGSGFLGRFREAGKEPPQ
jgi:hypothetical protein